MGCEYREVCDLIESDGIGNALAMVEPSAINDKDLSHLWRSANDSLRAVEQYLSEVC